MTEFYLSPAAKRYATAWFGRSFSPDEISQILRDATDPLDREARRDALLNLGYVVPE